jgi:GDP-4-dehydro-6-deoxy-D-mannose reductase
MVFASTGDVYGTVPESELPIDERRSPVPRNPYSVSKVASEALCKQWSLTEGIDIRIARPFNHIGPGQSDAFVVSSLARQIAAVKAARRDAVLDVGDIDVTRDFTDVGDVVLAYHRLLLGGITGEIYNVCTGVEHSIRDLIERLSRIAGVSVVIREDPSRLRPAEQRRVRGNAAKIRREIGWGPRVPLDESLRATLEFWGHADGVPGGK